MPDKYKGTIYACFVGYIVQSVVNNFAPLLFVTFHESYGIPLSEITLLVSVNFTVQLCVDIASVKLVDKLGYRASVIIAHAASAAGLVLLAVLPDALPNPFVGILLAAVLYAIGSGLIETVISPIMEACPTDNKSRAMSLLHSFYCWGHVGVVLLSTLFFSAFGLHRWKLLALLWALIPLFNLMCFVRVPICTLIKNGENGMRVRELCSKRVFIIFFILMICSGASEQAVSQWASAFAEQALGISKTLGDLAGPMLFAMTMGTARALYGKFGGKIELERFINASTILCVASYLIISLSPLPALSLIGCGICGFSIGILWPGTYSLASAAMPAGGTAMFALLALGGDIGCCAGPTFVGLISSAFNNNLSIGILGAIIFPLLLLLCLALKRKSA